MAVTALGTARLDEVGAQVKRAQLSEEQWLPEAKPDASMSDTDICIGMDTR